MTGQTSIGLRRAVFAAAMMLGGALAGTSAEAAPLSAPPVEAVAGQSGATAVHWHHRHRHWGYRRHRHWGHRHHRHGWGHRHHHHRGHHGRGHHFY